MKLKKGDRVFLSERGNNGFFYPTEMSETLIADARGDERSWAGGCGKQAVLIPVSCIRALGNDNYLIPVWIDKLREE